MKNLLNKIIQKISTYRRMSHVPCFMFNDQRGFTLVETLIAIIIFSVAITGVITAASIGGTSISASRNQVTAHYLAEEGIELLRAKRDSTVVAAADPQTGWTDFVGLATASCGTGSCDVDITSTGLPFTTTCTTGCPPLKYDASSGYYSYASGTDSIFTRRLTVAVVPSNVTGDEVKITSTVSWLQGSAPKTYTLSENLYNWYQ